MPPYTLYTVAQMREAERRAAAEYGISLATLMENAGRCLAQTAMEMCPAGPVAVLCGKGNNGGDGYVCATVLLRQGIPVTVWGMGRGEWPEGSLAGAAAETFVKAGGVILPFTMDTEIDGFSLIVDALFGTGLAQPLTGVYAYAVKLMNAAQTPVLSCDVPSGIDADTGRIMGVAVRAARTLMLGLAKPACDLPPGNAYFGALQLGDIGLPQELKHAVFPDIEKSCGAVLFTEINGERRYALVRSLSENNCGFPKGHVEKGETEEETALREIFEETCVHAEIIKGFRKQIAYSLPNGNTKQVIFFIAKYQNQEARANPNEKTVVLLLPLDEALRAIPFDNTRKLLLDADKWLITSN